MSAPTLYDPERPAATTAAGPRPRIGSVCTGYGGLDEAVQQVFGGELAWASDIDPGACQIIAHRMPGVPNLGDLTAVDWAEVEPVDIVIGGYPCQPFSIAGELKGTTDDRHIWPFIAGALRVLRPRYAIFENVANHLRIGFDIVLQDLAEIGFDAEWCIVRADEVGAPHQRKRLFLLATAADANSSGLEGRGLPGAVAELNRVAENADGAALTERRLAAPGEAEAGSTRSNARGRGGAPATNAQGVGRPEGEPEPAVREGRHATAGGCRASAPDSRRGELAKQPFSIRGSRDQADAAFSVGVAADTDRDGREEQQRSEPGMGARGNADGRGPERWGRYAPAVARWEAVTGRPAPWATDDRRRLSPAFVEWMMGLPAGHVTDVPGLTRNQQLKALGNGVVPQQAAAAIRLLAERAGVLEAAA